MVQQLYWLVVLCVGSLVVTLASAGCPNSVETEMAHFLGLLAPFGFTEHTLKPDPNAEKDVAAKVGKLTRSFNNLVRKTSGADIRFGEKLLAEVMEAKEDFIEEVEAVVRKYQEKIKALNVGIVKTVTLPEADVKEREIRKQLINKMVYSSRIQFYKEVNLTEPYQIIEIGRPEEIGSCKNLDALRRNSSKLSMLTTFDTCVRLFKDRNCDSTSLALYPGLILQELLTPVLPVIESVGPCYKTEFDLSSFTQTPDGGLHVEKAEADHREIPILLTHNFDDCAAKTVKESMFTYLDKSKTRYISDCSNRTAWLQWRVTRGDVSYEDLTSSSSGHLDTTHWNSMEKEAGDMLGFAISPHLGGCSQEPRNVFPQSLSNFDAWNEVTEKIWDFLVQHPGSNAQVSLKFVFPDQEIRRPHGMYWIVDFGETSHEEGRRVYGYIDN